MALVNGGPHNVNATSGLSRYFIEKACQLETHHVLDNEALYPRPSMYHLIFVMAKR